VYLKVALVRELNNLIIGSERRASRATRCCPVLETLSEAEIDPHPSCSGLLHHGVLAGKREREAADVSRVIYGPSALETLVTRLRRLRFRMGRDSRHAKKQSNRHRGRQSDDASERFRKMQQIGPPY
jgi:hypothetical protein